MGTNCFHPGLMTYLCSSCLVLSDTFLLEGHLYEQHYEHRQRGSGGPKIRCNYGTRQGLPGAVFHLDKAVSFSTIQYKPKSYFTIHEFNS